MVAKTMSQEPEPDMSQARLEKIETKLSFAEDLLEELNHLVFRQQEQIKRLQAQLDSLADKQSNSEPNERFDPRDDIPPHY
jgi:SlyX protein